MDPKHFIFNSFIKACFPSWDYTELYCFMQDHVNVISMNPFRIKERIDHPSLRRTQQIKYMKDDNTFLINTHRKLIKFDPDTRTITELLEFNELHHFDVSQDGRFITVVVGINEINVRREVYEDLELISTKMLGNVYAEDQIACPVDNEGYVYISTNETITKCDGYDQKPIAEYKVKEDGDSFYRCLSEDNKLLIGRNGVGVEITNTETMKFVGWLETKDDEYQRISEDMSKIFKITPAGTEIYSTANMELLAFIDTVEILPTPEQRHYWRINNVSDCNDMLFITTSTERIYIYDIKKMKFIGKFTINRSNSRDSEIIITKNHRYLFMHSHNYLVRFDLIQLDINDQKRAIIQAEDIPGNAVHRFTHDRLYDWHLMREIFKFLPKL